MKFDPAGVQEVSRKLFSTLYNTYSFFALYANVDGFDNSQPQVALENRPEIDRWIISLLNTLVKDVDEALNDYEPTKAARAINDFVNDNLSNWYVRLNRKRFWGGEMNEDKLSAYQTLYTCLETIAKLIAPISPFYADKLYQDLAGNGSVHLALFPEVNENAIDKALENRMNIAQVITSMVLSLRRKVNIKVRQPLSTLMIPVMDDAQREAIESMSELILNEVNVKNFKFVDNEAGVLVKRVKPDFKKLGPKFGKTMKAVAAAITSMSQQEIASLEKNGNITLNIDGNDAVIEAVDVEIISEDIPGWLVANEGNITIALDVTITEELKQEGIARDIVNRVQNIRKSRDYDITDKINLVFAPNADTDAAINAYSDYIARQVLATSISVGNIEGAEGVETLEIDEIKVDVSITK